MNSNIYKAPEQDIEHLLDITPYSGLYSCAMRVAIGVLIGIELFLIVLSQYGNNNFDLVNLVFSILLNIIYVLVIVFLLGKLRGVEVWEVDRTQEIRDLNAWGYIWRCVVVQIVACFLALVTLVVTGLSKSIDSPSVELTITSGSLTLAFIPLVVWLIFSRNRKRQLLWVFTIFRGL